MRAITIMQPYASAIVYGHSHRGMYIRKSIENRQSWRFQHRGPLLIHAGISDKWLSSWDYGSRPTQTVSQE